MSGMVGDEVNERHETVQKFAAAMKWAWDERHREFVYEDPETTAECGLALPLYSDPFDVHLAFVGRLAEALKLSPNVTWTAPENGYPRVSFGRFQYRGGDLVGDIAFAAMLAAIEVKR